jgi:hypothetical protein
LGTWFAVTYAVAACPDGLREHQRADEPEQPRDNGQARDDEGTVGYALGHPLLQVRGRRTRQVPTRAGLHIQLLLSPPTERPS